MNGEPSKTEEELELEKAVFGDLEGFYGALNSLNAARGDDESASESENSTDAREAEAEDDDDNLFLIDRGENKPRRDSSSSAESDGIESPEEENGSDRPVWLDADTNDSSFPVSLMATARTKKLRHALSEDVITSADYEMRLRRHFEKLNPRPKWAIADTVRVGEGTESESEDIPKPDEDDEDDDENHLARADPLKALLSQRTSYVAASPSRLIPAGTLDIQRLQDITKQVQCQAVVQALQFHPTHSLVLAAGFDQTLRIYQVDGRHNPLATSLFIRNSPFRTARFHPDGRRVFASGRRKYMYIWDLHTGSVERVSQLYGHEDTQRTMQRFELSPQGHYVGLIGNSGWLNILSADSGQWIAAAKIDVGSIADAVWVEAHRMLLASGGGDFFVYDVPSKQFVSRWRDQSLVGVTAVAVSRHWLAVGMDSGIVSIYNLQSEPKSLGIGVPLRDPAVVIENLVTSISSLKFSPDGQLLVIASRGKKDAMRMLHVPSFSVYRNWPTAQTPLGRVSAVAWAPQNNMIAVGNEGGFIRLWGLNYYSH